MGKILTLVLGIVVLVVSALIFSCAPDSPTGDLIGNVPPIIGFTNLPLNDSLCSSSPVVYWYGIDSDGIIDNYFYKIVLVDSMPGSDPDNYANTILDTLNIDEWVMTESTQVKILLFADTSETDTLQQYVFIKCQDDAGDFSEVIYLNLFRVNHIPETYLDLLPGNRDTVIAQDTILLIKPVWSLPDTNALWEGFDISWKGEDTLDFLEDPPDFQYKWKLFGPYDTTSYNQSDSIIDLSISDTTSDKLFIMSCADNDSGYISVDDGVCEDPWVWKKKVTLVGLPTGCYIFTISVRDDANVEDRSVAYGTFYCIMPTWCSDPEMAKDILVVQATDYWSGYLTSDHNGQPAEWVFAGDDTLRLDTLHFPTLDTVFYKDMIEGAGNFTYTIYDSSVVIQAPYSVAAMPPIQVLANYRMIIFDELDLYQNNLRREENYPFINILKDYLSIGGKAWVIGRQTFHPGSWDFSGPFEFDPGSLAFDFFDLSSYFLTEKDSLVSVEFIGATSVYTAFEDLCTDPERTLLMGQYGINKVSSLVRFSGYSQTLFTYNAAKPDTMPNFDGMPCAVKYFPENEIFKTSYFSFPLFFMDNSNGEVQAVFTDMLAWFLEEDD